MFSILKMKAAAKASRGKWNTKEKKTKQKRKEVTCLFKKAPLHQDLACIIVGPSFGSEHLKFFFFFKNLCQNYNNE